MNDTFGEVGQEQPPYSPLNLALARTQVQRAPTSGLTLGPCAAEKGEAGTCERGGHALGCRAWTRAEGREPETRGSHAGSEQLCEGVWLPPQLKKCGLCPLASSRASREEEEEEERKARAGSRAGPRITAQ